MDKACLPLDVSVYKWCASDGVVEEGQATGSVQGYADPDYPRQSCLLLGLILYFLHIKLWEVDIHTHTHTGLTPISRASSRLPLAMNSYMRQRGLLGVLEYPSNITRFG